MHLRTLLSLRARPGAGIYYSLTRRCPLGCRHCSTNSLLTSEEGAYDDFIRFTSTFTNEHRPEVVLLTGGEPLLRPRLIAEIIEKAHRVGTKVQMLSGLYFADKGFPPLIRRSIQTIDHFSVSLDEFHEEQVSRQGVFNTVQEILDLGIDVSFQLVARSVTDPYALRLIEDIRHTFDDRIPMLVSPLKALGRAKSWVSPMVEEPRDRLRPMPCLVASWPVVTFDGTIVACCNEDVVEGRGDDHLVIGHIQSTTWQEVIDGLHTPPLRAIRAVGPEVIAANLNLPEASGYCAVCRTLSQSQDFNLTQASEEVMAHPLNRVLEQWVPRAQQHQPSWLSMPPFQPLMELGFKEEIDFG